MKNKYTLIAVLLLLLSTASFGQYNRTLKTYTEGENSYLKFGTQVPFQHSLIYDHRITPGFSINGGLGLIAAPYTNMRFAALENRGLITSTDRDVLERSFRSGLSYQLGANFHFQKNYVRVFGQLTHLNGDLAITDLVNLYLKTNIPPVANFLNPIEINSNVPMVGMLFGRRFPVGPRSEFHAEVSLSKTLGHNTTYKTGTFVDHLAVVNDIVYSGLNHDLDNYFSNYGWIPSLNIYYVYKF
jgi:hypothetical protein